MIFRSVVFLVSDSVHHYHMPNSGVLTRRWALVVETFQITRLFVGPLIARPLTDSHGNLSRMTVAYSILSRIQQAMSFCCL